MRFPRSRLELRWGDPQLRHQGTPYAPLAWHHDGHRRANPVRRDVVLQLRVLEGSAASPGSLCLGLGCLAGDSIRCDSQSAIVAGSEEVARAIHRARLLRPVLLHGGLLDARLDDVAVAGRRLGRVATDRLAAAYCAGALP